MSSSHFSLPKELMETISETWIKDEFTRTRTLKSLVIVPKSKIYKSRYNNAETFLYRVDAAIVQNNRRQRQTKSL